MKITTIKTSPLSPNNAINLVEVIDQCVTKLSERSILTITSKIVSICEKRVVKATSGVDEKDLVREESDYYLPAEVSKYNITISIKNNLLIPTAGIDESNGDGYYILWPKDPQKSANLVRKHLRDKFKLKELGVMITDSKTTPLRWGTTGVAIGYSGFDPLNNYIDTPDVFGRHLKVTKANVLDGLTAAAVVVMGEGDECTPLAFIENVPFVHFVENDPTQEELDNLKISIEDDLYAPLIKNADWHKGGGGK
ncbi:coenzyme F420-0:L-glutamate ligase [Candidatus Woesebacteria bacterium]|nr:coenzyme F420-0:L-glutamate ligase [Candidatus Woesebacteria bacterium]